jgi:beta-keto acid cleavage enzyme
VSEPGLAELLGALNAAGVAVEAGVWSVADAEALAALGPPAPSPPAPSPSGPWLRILVEIMGVPAAGAVAAADEILRRLDELGVTAPRLLHGEEAGCWPLVARAGKLGLPTRIGLEDTITGPDAAAVTSNAELIRLALPIWAAAAP